MERKLWEPISWATVRLFIDAKNEKITVGFFMGNFLDEIWLDNFNRLYLERYLILRDEAGADRKLRFVAFNRHRPRPLMLNIARSMNDLKLNIF